MQTYSASRAEYFDILDVLYIYLGDEMGLLRCSSIEDTPSGMTVMRDRDGAVTGVEVYDLYDKFGCIPDSITVDSITPFTVSIEQSDGDAAA